MENRDFNTGYTTIPNVGDLIKGQLITDILKFHNSIGIVTGDFDIEWECGGIEENSLWFKFTCNIKDLAVDYIDFGDTKYEGEFFINVFTKKSYIE